MSCDGYCFYCGEPFNYDEKEEKFVYGCECRELVVEEALKVARDVFKG